VFIELIENGPFFVNTYLVGCPKTKEAILIDPGHEADRISARMSESGMTFTAIVNTHGHLDHLASARHFQQTLEIPFRMHQGDAFLLQSLSQQCAAFGLPPIDPPEVTDWLEADTRYQVGDVGFDLRPAPGHSPGSLIFDFGDQMIVGDVIFEGSIGRTNLPGGDTVTLLESIRQQVLSKDDGTTLHSGHGPSTTVGQERRHNPFLVDLRS